MRTCSRTERHVQLHNAVVLSAFVIITVYPVGIIWTLHSTRTAATLTIPFVNNNHRHAKVVSQVESRDIYNTTHFLIRNCYGAVIAFSVI